MDAGLTLSEGPSLAKNFNVKCRKHLRLQLCRKTSVYTTKEKNSSLSVHHRGNCLYKARSILTCSRFNSQGLILFISRRTKWPRNAFLRSLLTKQRYHSSQANLFQRKKSKKLRKWPRQSSRKTTQGMRCRRLACLARQISSTIQLSRGM